MAYPYVMTYTPVAGDTILAAHITTSNQEHIDSNIPENIDDYSVNATEMGSTQDPYAADTEVLATTLADELKGLRFQVDSLIKKFNTSASKWYHNVTNEGVLVVKGADVASAAALPLINDGQRVDVTGTTAITSMNTVGVGTVKILQFDGALTLTHHSTDLVLPNGNNIKTAAGDRAVFHEYASGDWELIGYQGAGSAVSARKNAVINGEGRIRQRTAYTLVKDQYGFSPDRFEGMATGTAVSAGTLNSTSAANVGTTGYAHKFVSVTLTGTGILYHRHRIEGLNAVFFKNQTASLSVKVYHDVGSAKTFTLYVRKADASDDFSAVTEISNDGGTSVSSATATTLTFEGISMGDCSNGIELELKMEVGAITTKNVEITEWQLELGATATPFEYRDYHTELAMCKRYYEKLNGEGLASYHYGIGFCHSATEGRAVLYYTEKRATPTTISDSGDANFRLKIKAGTDVEATTMTWSIPSRQTVSADITVASGLTAGEGCRLVDDSNALSWVGIDAELS